MCFSELSTELLISETGGMFGRIAIHSQYTRYESVAHNSRHSA